MSDPRRAAVTLLAHANAACDHAEADEAEELCSVCCEAVVADLLAFPAAMERGNALLRAEIATLRESLAAAEEALAWYGEKAESLANKDWHKNPSYAEAIFTEMALDAGRRARAVRERLAVMLGR